MDEHSEYRVGGFRLHAATFPRDLTLDAHHHDHAVCGVILDGGVETRYHGYSFTSPPATFDIKPPGERHGNRFGPGGARVVIIETMETDSDALRGCRPLLEAPVCVRHAKLLEVAQRMDEELGARDDVTPLAIEGLTYELLAVATRAWRRRRPRSPAALGSVQEYLHAHYRTRIKLADLAREARVHPSHLSRAFRRAFGVSVGEYVRALRVEWAARQIASTDEPLSQIALDAGFSDQSKLTHVFKRHRGFTPAAYRRETREMGGGPAMHPAISRRLPGAPA